MAEADMKGGRRGSGGRAIYVLGYLLITLLAAVVVYVLFSLFFRTDTERMLRREIRMYERIYPELAERAGLSRNSFIRLFREKTGETPQQFRLRKSVEYAAGELHYSTHSIEEIAEAAGFSDRFHFTKVFGRFMQMPPAAYRRITRGQGGATKE